MALDQQALTEAIERSCAAKARWSAATSASRVCGRSSTWGIPSATPSRPTRAMASGCTAKRFPPGMVMALQMSLLLGWLTAAQRDRALRLLVPAGLPVVPPPTCSRPISNASWRWTRRSWMDNSGWYCSVIWASRGDRRLRPRHSRADAAYRLPSADRPVRRTRESHVQSARRRSLPRSLSVHSRPVRRPRSRFQILSGAAQAGAGSVASPGPLQPVVAGGQRSRGQRQDAAAPGAGGQHQEGSGALRGDFRAERRRRPHRAGPGRQGRGRRQPDARRPFSRRRRKCAWRGRRSTPGG